MMTLSMIAAIIFAIVSLGVVFSLVCDGLAYMLTPSEYDGE